MTRPRKPSLTWVSSTARRAFGRRAKLRVEQDCLGGGDWVNGVPHNFVVEVILYPRSGSREFVSVVRVEGRGTEQACAMALGALRAILGES